MMVLSTFLESSINLLSDIRIKNSTKFGIVREKSGVKVENYRNRV